MAAIAAPSLAMALVLKDSSGHRASAMPPSAGFGLGKPFLVVQGRPLERIGSFGMGAGAATVLIGWAIGRIGAWKVLLGGVAFCASGLLLWLAMAASLPHRRLAPRSQPCCWAL